ncbi:unnamed protein product [Bathycoccus prasinos]
MRGKASSSRRKKRRVPEADDEEEEEGVVLSSSTTSGGTTTTSDDDEEEEEDVQKTKKKRRGKHPSRETIKCAFEQLCAAGKAEEDRKQHHSEKDHDDEKKAGRRGKGGVMKGFSIQNLLEMCVKFGYQNWTVLDVENMIRAYELSEAKGEIIRAVNQHHLDSKQSKEDVILEVTEKGFREIVRKCGKISIHNTDKDSKEDFKDSDGDGVGDFKDAFVSSLAMILVAELGDETFIIAAIMAMRHPRLIVLSGALSALAIMTVLSTAMGVLAPMLISPKVVNKCAFVLYTFFGCRLFYIAWRSKPGSSMQDEVDEVAEKIDVEKAPKGKIRRILSRVCTPIFLEAFVLTFLAEWGDRSQITTIALAAHKDPYGVTIGAIIGHAFCTSLAVIGGKILALKISQRLVAAVGGMLFIVFAWHALIFGAPGTELSKND